jgi:hypothetical protein
MSKSVPLPAMLVQLICPPNFWVMMLKTMDRPSPLPPRSRAVVKKGSKMCFWTSGSMPAPLSATRRWSNPLPWSASTRMVPPLRSRKPWVMAFMARLVMICEKAPG